MTKTTGQQQEGTPKVVDAASASARAEAFGRGRVADPCEHAESAVPTNF